MPRLFVTLLAATVLAVSYANTRVPRPADAELYFISPRDGETVKGPVTVRFGLKGMGVAPAGIALPDTGHHHLLINTPLPVNLGVPLPATDAIRHFGKGQTEAVIELPPGSHALQLVFGDHLHVPHQPPLISKRITITVTR